MRTEYLLRWLTAAVASSFASSLTVASDTPVLLPDDKIAKAVEVQLRFSTPPLFNHIDVYTAAGVVHLEGEADTALAKQRATLLAETVRGVRLVANRIKVIRDPDLSPAQLESSIEEAMLYDPIADSYEVSVRAHNDGSVVLSGTVDSWQESRLAEQLALGVNGVTAVRNEIGISDQPERPDSEMEEEIERMLAWSILIDDALIDVSVTDDVAHLKGVVGSSAERRRAGTLAWVGGIDRVDTSELRVETWTRNDNREESSHVTMKGYFGIDASTSDETPREPNATSVSQQSQS